MKKTVYSLFLSALVVHMAQCSISDFFKDTKLFTQEILHNRNEVGAIFSCSSFTAHELTRYLKADQEAETCYILEIGAGTGPVTEKISAIIDAPENAHKNYVFDVVEINENMCKHLVTKFYDRPNVRIHCCSILDWKPEYKYHYIVSTLPHTSLGTELVKDILAQYQALIQPNGMLSYIEYIGVAKLREFILPKQEKQEFIEIRRLLAQLRKKHTFKTKRVFLNILPLYVHHLQFK